MWYRSQERQENVSFNPTQFSPFHGEGLIVSRRGRSRASLTKIENILFSKNIYETTYLYSRMKYIPW